MSTLFTCWANTFPQCFSTRSPVAATTRKEMSRTHTVTNYQATQWKWLSSTKRLSKLCLNSAVTFLFKTRVCMVRQTVWLRTKNTARRTTMRRIIAQMRKIDSSLSFETSNKYWINDMSYQARNGLNRVLGSPEMKSDRNWRKFDRKQHPPKFERKKTESVLEPDKRICFISPTSTKNSSQIQPQQIPSPSLVQ